jgi:hypothetical protein
MKRSWPNFRFYPSICLERLRKSPKKTCQDTRCRGRDFNLGPPEYEGLFTTRPRLSVSGSGRDAKCNGCL